jgi:two-component system, NtrC family, response regulator GlrR
VEVERAGSSPTSPPADILAPRSERRPITLNEVRTAHAGYAIVLGHIARMVDTDLSILILGESGTGKEHLARAIHAQSKRAAGPFFPVNLSCMTESLIESELFGHVKGAFTGTESSRDGAFVSASGGTLFLDEFGDAPLRVQLALLRVLENRTVRPVGADRERAVDVRIIAATSRNLRTLILEERFREDLYQRVADLPVTIPPLRERASDVPYIARTILKSLGSNATLAEDALSFLRAQLWRGNVRALKRALRRAIELAEGSPVIRQRHFGTFEAPCQSPLPPRASAFQQPSERSVISFGLSMNCQSWVSPNTNGGQSTAPRCSTSPCKRGGLNSRLR